MPARTRPATVQRPPSFLTSLLATLAALTCLVLVVGSVIVGLVALAEPYAMFDAIRDGFAYLWASLVEAVS